MNYITKVLLSHTLVNFYNFPQQIYCCVSLKLALTRKPKPIREVVDTGYMEIVKKPEI